MPTALDYVQSLSLGQRAASITKANNDAWLATGYAALIQSLTGTPPTVVDLGNKRARFVLTAAQNAIMKKWLEQRVAVGIKIVKSPSNLEINAGPYVMPVVLKYAVPAMVTAFALGWFVHNMMGGR